jgi:AraC family transcriptional regulator of adaptative response/methylated-DNA-[protein]-cysteine methyltransferase
MNLATVGSRSEPLDLTTGADAYTYVAEAIRYLGTNFQRQPSLDELSAHLSVSPYYLQRLFSRWAGISPKRFVQFLTVEHAKQALAGSQSVLDASWESGLSGPGRLHDLFVTVEAVTPGEFKSGGRGLRIAYGFHPSPFGACLLAVTERGICSLAFVDPGREAIELNELRARWPAAMLVEERDATAATLARVFPPDGGLPRQPLHLLLKGTNFQVKVWEALLRIPPGALCSYEDVAQAVGQPTAARAVGGAVGSNRIGYLIPCHRVIRKSGIVTNYYWGPVRKRAMIGWEAAHADEYAERAA